MDIALAIPLIIGSSVMTLVIGLIIRKYYIKTSSDNKIKKAISDANKEAKKIIYKSKTEIRVKEIALEKEIQQKQNELDKLFENFQTSHEKRTQQLVLREKKLNVREDELSEKYSELSSEKRKLNRQYNEKIFELEDKIDEHISLLTKVANLTEKEAKEQIISNLKNKLHNYILKEYEYAKIELEMKKKELSQQILADTIDRYAESVVGERAITFVSLPSEELKGKIIGKEGRNIRAFEMATGVDLLIDDDTTKIRISSFNPIRREIARITLDKLIELGTIQPTKIEEEFEKTSQEFGEDLIEIGKKAVFEANIGYVHPELLPIIGRLNFRSSYGQNSLTHTIEVCKLAGEMAKKIGADPMLARRVAFFHDIGKAVDFEAGGDHVDSGYQLAQKYNLEKEVLNAIKSHHGNEPHESVYAVLTRAADALSSSRPGARRNSYEQFVQRMETIEKLAQKFKGVKRAYALASGRQVRVLVEPKLVTDNETVKLAIDIGQELEEQLKMPGEIIITVIREFRAIQKANKNKKEV